MIHPDNMLARVYCQDLFGKTIWRLMATRGGQVCGLGNMIDFDDREEAENAAISHARRNRWALWLETYTRPGTAPTSTRSFPAL